MGSCGCKHHPYEPMAAKGLFGESIGDLSALAPTLCVVKRTKRKTHNVLSFYCMCLVCVFIFKGITNKFNFNAVNSHMYLLRSISWHLY